MATDNKISVLPVWKKNGTLAERLEEMANYARASPERFNKFVMVFQEQLPNGCWKVRHMTHECSSIEAFGLMQVGLHDMIDESYK